MSWLFQSKTRRIMAMLLATVMVIGGAGLPAGRSSAESAIMVNATAQASPAEVTAGSDTTVNVQVTASQTTAVLIDVEVYDSTLKRVNQTFIDNVAVTAGVPTTVPAVWHVPSGQPSGSYIVSVGVFGAGWSSNVYEWFAGITSITVSGSGTGGGGEGGGSTQQLPAPANVSATAGQTSVSLTWDAVEGAASYDVEDNGTIVGNVYGISYDHSSLLPDTAHSYRIRAVNEQGPGSWSGAAAARTLVDPMSVLQISAQTGTNETAVQLGPNFTIKNTSSQSIPLEDLKVRYYFTLDNADDVPLQIGFWSSVSQNVLKAVKMPVPAIDADYYLEIAFAQGTGMLNGGSSVYLGTWINKTGWSSFSQSNDYSYTATSEMTPNPKVAGILGNTLVWGTEPELLDVPPFPSGFTAVPADSSITLTWDAVENATSYDVRADGVVTSGLTDLTFVHDWLRSGTRHTYAVRTHNGDKLGTWSAPLSLKTTGLQSIPAPVNVRSEKTDTSIKLTWSAPDAAIIGYDVEVDGTVLDNGAATSYLHDGLTPGSAHTYRVRAKDEVSAGEWSSLLTLNTTQTPTGPFTVQFAIDPNADQAPISPYIYGTNDDLTGTENWTARRMGGNRMTTYNWENNASNSGNDAGFHSDSYVANYFGGVPWGENTDEPAIGTKGFHRKSLETGAYTLTTLQAAGYVAKDKDGYVTQEETAPSPRWAQVLASKGAPLSLLPDLNDNVVYMDEYVNSLVHTFGDASTPTGIKGYELDNEPGIWFKTHEYMHPERPGAAEVLNKGLALARSVKAVDPNAELFGPVTFGFDDMHSMYVASDWPSLKANYDWYLDYYLDKFREASLKDGKRLLDVLDIHWYPETMGGGYRINDSNGTDNPETNKARIQAPRQLWDTSYSESNNWLFDSYSSFFPLVPRLQQSIDMYYPGTKLAITEYNFGGETNVYGGIAQADVLGIYGKYGVYMANFWRMTNGSTQTPYISSAFKLFTNYDGQNGKYGDTKVKAETTDIENSSVYSSVYRDNDNKLHVIILNKNSDYEMNASVNISGDKSYTSAQVWAFDSESPDITERQPVAQISGNTFTYTIPKLTAVHFVLSTDEAESP
jgi:hypothetical protein